MKTKEALAHKLAFETRLKKLAFPSPMSPIQLNSEYR